MIHPNTIILILVDDIGAKWPDHSGLHFSDDFFQTLYFLSGLIPSTISFINIPFLHCLLTVQPSYAFLFVYIPNSDGLHGRYPCVSKSREFIVLCDEKLQ